MFELLRGYRLSWLRTDVIAGITVAAIAIPESLGYANIAGLPVQTGLYCALLPAVLFALIASSRQLVVGADSATAAIVAAGAGAVAATGSTQYTGAVAILTLMAGLFLGLMAVARLGFLADLISKPVLAGFLSGVGVSLVIGKLPAMLGISASGNTWDKLVATVQGLGDINGASALLSAGVVLIIILGERFVPKLPAALFAVVAMSLVGLAIDAGARGVVEIGKLPAGLPGFAFPPISAGEIPRLAASAASIAIVVLAQSAAVSRSFAAKNRYPLNVNGDLVGLAAANAASSVTGGFAINGSPPRTAAGDSAGSRSQMVNLVMAAVIGLILLFATGLFAYVPSPVLDAVVFAIGIGLIKVSELREVVRARPGEAVSAFVALVVVAFVGVEQGVLLAVLISVIDVLRRQYRPDDIVLLHNNELDARLRQRIPDMSKLEGVLVYRFGAELFFENAAHFADRVRTLVAEAATPVRLLVVDCAAMSDIDYSGASVLRELGEELAGSNARIVLTELSEDAQVTVERMDLGPAVTTVPRLEDAVRAVGTP
ncbi:MAG: SulP family inorganic anion transporter [Ornithinibacter sp.]